MPSQIDRALRDVITAVRPALVHVNDIWWVPQTLCAVEGMGVQIVAHVIATHRNAVGTDVSIMTYLRSPEWSPPFGVWALLIGTVVTVVAYVFWLGLLATSKDS